MSGTVVLEFEDELVDNCHSPDAHVGGEQVSKTHVGQWLVALDDHL